MTRGIILNAGDEDAVNASLGYPYPCFNAATGAIVPGVFTTKHRDPETDTLARQVLVVDDVEASLPAPLRARVVTVTRAVAVDDGAVEDVRVR